ncbi:MAG: hypothetical protein ACI4F7_08435 [Acutalibacteraceae bacterium]
MKRKILRAATGFLYLFLNLFLIIICALVPFYYSVIALTQPQTVTTIIQNIDYKELVKSTPAVETTLKKYGIDYKKADEIMKSKETGKLIELYTDEATEILLSIPDNRKFDSSLVKELVDDNIDEVLTVAKETSDLKFNESRVKTAVNQYIAENESELEAVAPVLEQARTVIKQIKLSKIVARTLSLPFIIIFTAFMLAVALLIFLIKRRSFNGLLFLGLDFTAVSLALGLTIYFCKSSFVTSLALKMSDFGVSIIESAVSVCTDRIIIALIISAVLAVLGFMFFAALRYLNSSPPKIADTSDGIAAPCGAEP